MSRRWRDGADGTTGPLLQMVIEDKGMLLKTLGGEIDRLKAEAEVISLGAAIALAGAKQIIDKRDEALSNALQELDSWQHHQRCSGSRCGRWACQSLYDMGDWGKSFG